MTARTKAGKAAPKGRQMYDVVLTLENELLGTCSANPNIYREFIESKRPETNKRNEDETVDLPSVDAEVQKSTTVFMRTEKGEPYIMGYHIKGFFKDACGMLRRSETGPSAALKAFKKEIDGLIFVTPRKIVAEIPAGATVGICTRPLRAQTAQGERVSLARSETLPAGTVFRFEVVLLRGELFDAMEEWLDYGAYRGLGQWRNSGKGVFSYSLTAKE